MRMKEYLADTLGEDFDLDAISLEIADFMLNIYNPNGILNADLLAPYYEAEAIQLAQQLGLDYWLLVEENRK